MNDKDINYKNGKYYKGFAAKDTYTLIEELEKSQLLPKSNKRNWSRMPTLQVIKKF